MDWSDWLALLSQGGVLYLLADRFLRTKEQKGGAVAQMMSQMSDACSKTLETVTTYTQKVIDSMRLDRERDDHRYAVLEKRYDQQEARYERLEAKFEEAEEDRELMKTIINGAVNCTYLKTGDNKDCPVIKANQKRLSQRCKTCKTDKKL